MSVVLQQKSFPIERNDCIESSQVHRTACVARALQIFHFENITSRCKVTRTREIFNIPFKITFHFIRH